MFLLSSLLAASLATSKFFFDLLIEKDNFLHVTCIKMMAYEDLLHTHSKAGRKKKRGKAY